MDWTLKQLQAKMEQNEAMDKLEQAGDEMKKARLALEEILEGEDGTDNDFLQVL